MSRDKVEPFIGRTRDERVEAVGGGDIAIDEGLRKGKTSSEGDVEFTWVGFAF